MKRERLILSTVKALRFDPQGPRTQIVWDADLPGLGVRVYPSGLKSWVCFYRVGRGRAAKQRTYVLGSIAKLSPDQARNGDRSRGILGAREVLAAAVNGVDLVAERGWALEEQRAAEERHEVEGLTFADVAAK